MKISRDLLHIIERGLDARFQRGHTEPERPRVGDDDGYTAPPPRHEQYVDVMAADIEDDKTNAALAACERMGADARSKGTSERILLASDDPDLAVFRFARVQDSPRGA